MQETMETTQAMIDHLAAVNKILEKYGYSEAKLIPILQEVQAVYKYLSRDMISYVATSIGVPPSRVYGVATFYAHFSMQPKGKYLIKLCDGTACHVKKSHGLLNALYERLESAYSEAYDIAFSVAEQRENFDFSPNELDEVEGRLDQLYRLKKKYGATVEDMLTYLDNCRRELDDIAYVGDALERLEKDCAKAEKAARKAAAELSAARKAAGETLSQAILTELQQLDMGKIRFQVDFAEKPLDATGMDQVRFLMSANLGEELKPINKIASGGELARIMLAMKNVLSEQDHVATMVFDEVDTGVSGRAAQKVAEKMARISRHKQVLCVTHLPQLAAMADTHFSVEKGEANGRTFTRVQQLDRKQRQMELARLTGGSHVTETMLQGAEELLSQAEKFRAEISE